MMHIPVVSFGIFYTDHCIEKVTAQKVDLNFDWADYKDKSETNPPVKMYLAYLH
jgi:hypothetical protein